MTKKLANKLSELKFPLLLLDDNKNPTFVNSEDELIEIVEDQTNSGYDIHSVFDDFEFYPLELDPVTKAVTQGDRICICVTVSYSFTKEK